MCAEPKRFHCYSMSPQLLVYVSSVIFILGIGVRQRIPFVLDTLKYLSWTCHADIVSREIIDTLKADGIGIARLLMLGRFLVVYLI